MVLNFSNFHTVLDCGSIESKLFSDGFSEVFRCLTYVNDFFAIKNIERKKILCSSNDA